jgi:hypothetical protein
MPTQVLQEVDNNFIGVNSRLDPSNLQPGFAQSAYNVRLQRGTAQPRKGCARLLAGTTSDTMVGSGTYVNALGQDNIVLVLTDGIQLYNTETSTLGSKFPFPSQTIGGVPVYRKIDQGAPVDVVQALDKLYIFRGRETAQRYGTGGTSTTAALNLSHAQVLAGNSVTVTATWIPSTHATYAVGDEVTIFNILDTNHTTFNNTYLVTGVASTYITFVYQNNTGSTVAASSNIYACVVKAKAPLVWDGLNVTVIPQTSIIGNIQTQTGYTEAYGSVPPSDFGFYFQNRLVCNVSNDQLVISDIFSTLFDFQINNFIINQGGNDSIVGVLPWIENQFLVFMKRSIYIAYVETTSYGSTGEASPGANSMITVVTTQVGCLSRKSIVAAGQFVFFMSGKGVHVLTPQLDLKLIGQTMPLSEPIDDFFDSVNFAAADRVVASYYDNRFFIALPTKDTAGNYVTRPNAILIYNALNQQWECIDTYPAGLWIDDYAVCQYGDKRRQFILTRFTASSQNGGIFITEEFPNNDVSSTGDQFSGVNGTPRLPFRLPATLSQTDPDLIHIDARIRSRQYTFDNTNQKRFSRGEYQFNNITGDGVSIVARTHDPDVYETVMTYTFLGSATTDSTLRPRIALRGACMDMEVVFDTGRPALKSAALYAIVANRNMVSDE